MTNNYGPVSGAFRSNLSCVFSFGKLSTQFYQLRMP
ncbi:hypothetical protein LINGRAHAP2_LOCUS13571 [Linum grandiflorum]